MSLKVRTMKLVPLRLFGSMQKVARERDLDRGGLYDARGGAINIWCSPEDKPAGYNQKVTCGALAHPRNYMATAMPELNDSGGPEAPLVLQVEPECRGEKLIRSHEPTREEISWAVEKLQELVERGEDRLGEELGSCSLQQRSKGGEKP